MGTPREERLASNEAMFRIANERTVDWEERHAADARESYFCECADPECRQRVEMSRTDYESVRADSRHFISVPGHEIPDVETVIDTHDGWVVIEKCPEVTATVEALDARTGR